MRILFHYIELSDNARATAQNDYDRSYLILALQRELRTNRPLFIRQAENKRGDEETQTFVIPFICFRLLTEI